MKKLLISLSFAFSSLAGVVSVSNMRASKPDSIDDYINMRDVKAVFENMPNQSFGSYTAMTLGWKEVYFGNSGYGSEQEAREAALNIVKNLGTLDGLSEDEVWELSRSLNLDLRDDDKREAYLESIGSLVSNGYIVVRSSTIGGTSRTIFDSNTSFKYSLTLKIPANIKSRKKVSSYGAREY